VATRQVTGIREAGQVMPQALVEALMKDSTSLGLVFAHENSIMMQRIDKTVSAKEFMDMQTSDDLKDRTFGWVVTKGGQQSVESRQPFVMARRPDDEVCCIALMAGSFPGADAPEKSAHSASYHAAQKLKRKVERLYNSASNFGKFAELLKDDVEFTEDVDSLCKGDGAITFMMLDGTLVHKGNAPKSASYPWGAISDNLGHTEKPVAAPEKTGGLLGAFKKITGEAAPTPPPPAPPAPEVPKNDPAPVVAPSPDTVVPEGQIEFAMWKPKPGITKDKQLHRACNDKLGCVPDGAWDTYKTGGSFPVPQNGMKFQNQKLYENFRRAAAGASTKFVPKSVLTNIPAEPPKETETPKTPADVTHIVPSEEKKAFNEVFRTRGSVMSAIAESRQLIASPKFQRDNRASTTFEEQSGLKQGVYDTLGWSEEDLMELMNEHPHLAFLLLRDSLYSLYCIKAAENKTPEKQVQAPEQKPETGLKKGLLGTFKKAG